LIGVDNSPYLLYNRDLLTHIEGAKDGYNC